jgi:hypothetical protein
MEFPYAEQERIGGNDVAQHPDGRAGIHNQEDATGRCARAQKQQTSEFGHLMSAEAGGADPIYDCNEEQRFRG